MNKNTIESKGMHTQIQNPIRLVLSESGCVACENYILLVEYIGVTLLPLFMQGKAIKFSYFSLLDVCRNRPESSINCIYNMSYNVNLVLYFITIKHLTFDQSQKTRKKCIFCN